MCSSDACAETSGLGSVLSLFLWVAESQSVACPPAQCLAQSRQSLPQQDMVLLRQGRLTLDLHQASLSVHGSL
ncbi:unnamed protein product [Lota lota]